MSIDDFRIKLARSKSALLKAERGLSRERSLVRKEEVRRKIELGILVIKSGLDQEENAVILGAMIAAKNEILKAHHHRDFLKSLAEDFLKGMGSEN